MILRGRTCSFNLDRPIIVGILNVTPDSFSDGGRFMSVDKAIEHARKMVDEGADLIDVGGESTRPGAPAVDPREELERVLPVVKALRSEIAIPLSVDTNKSCVARAVVRSGVEFINDISGLTFDPDMAAVVAESGVGLILMHTRGRPDTMQQATSYEDVVAEVSAGLAESVNQALDAGIERDKIVVDPGIGFGKDVGGNLELLKRLAELAVLGYPIMLGTSRKSFLGRILDIEAPAERVAGGLATVALGYAGGARLFRVHDVAATSQAARVAKAICDGAGWEHS